MKIVWISHSSCLEGAERSLFEGLKGLIEQGHQVHVFVPTEGKLTALIDNIATSTTVVANPWWINERSSSRKRIKRYYYYFLSIFQFMVHLARIKPDLVATNTVVIPCGAIAAKLLRIPHVWFIREFLEEDHGFTFEFGRKASLRLVNWCSERVIVNSQVVYKKYSEYIPSEKLVVVYPNVNISNSQTAIPVPKKENTFYISLVGRKVPGKGQKDAVEALAILLDKKLDVYLWLIGSEDQSILLSLKN